MAQVIEKYIPFKYDSEGNVTNEIKVHSVEEDGQVVGRFVPEVSNEKEVKERSESFAKNYVKVEKKKPEYITREVKDEDE